jgi:predicted transcriptional regulator
MANREEYDWDDDDEEDESDEEEIDQAGHEIQKILKEISRVSRKHIEYLLLEGFIEPTDDPHVFKYTPEGLVLAQQKYEKLREEGLL